MGPKATFFNKYQDWFQTLAGIFYLCEFPEVEKIWENISYVLQVFFCWLKTTSTRLKTKTKSHSTAAAESEYAKTWMTVSVDFHWQISAPSTKLYQVTHVPCLNAPKNHVANRKKYSFCAEPATITGQRNPMDLGNCFSFKPRWIRVGSQLVKLHSICKMVLIKIGDDTQFIDAWWRLMKMIDTVTLWHNDCTYVVLWSDTVITRLTTSWRLERWVMRSDQTWWFYEDHLFQCYSTTRVMAKILQHLRCTKNVR